MSGKLPFREIGVYPEQIDAAGIIVRLFDGLGFRFYWATENLREQDYAYRPCPDAMSLGEIVQHIWGLMNWIHLNIHQKHLPKPQENHLARRIILEGIETLRETFSAMSKDDLAAIQIEKKPFWHLINGPVADALTHVGQINILRRAAGNPPIAVNPFLGVAPE